MNDKFFHRIAVLCASFVTPEVGAAIAACTGFVCSPGGEDGQPSEPQAFGGDAVGNAPEDGLDATAECVGPLS